MIVKGSFKCLQNHLSGFLQEEEETWKSTLVIRLMAMWCVNFHMTTRYYPLSLERHIKQKGRFTMIAAVNLNFYWMLQQLPSSAMHTAGMKFSQNSHSALPATKSVINQNKIISTRESFMCSSVWPCSKK